MNKVLVVGAGKIGSLISVMLSQQADYEVHVADVNFSSSDIQRALQIPSQNKIQISQIDVSDRIALERYVKEHAIDALVSCLPYFLNENVAKVARDIGAHYFDLTEDTKVTAIVKNLAQGANTALVPQCGLAPGFVGVVANDLIAQFDQAHTVKLRVGALPKDSSNSLHYALTWSTDGLINEYGNPCHAIENGHAVSVEPLEGYEEIEIDGGCYEAFNTSGGVGSLAQLHHGQIKNINYKTIRYPGHCEKIRFLMNDLQLNNDRATLKRILETALPTTYQDVVVIYVEAIGIISHANVEKTYVKKIYPCEIAGVTWSAIQISTASGLCTVLDIVLNNPEKYRGLINSENFPLKDVVQNRFGRCFA